MYYRRCAALEETARLQDCKTARPQDCKTARLQDLSLPPVPRAFAASRMPLAASRSSALRPASFTNC